MTDCYLGAFGKMTKTQLRRAIFDFGLLNKSTAGLMAVKTVPH